MNPNLNGQIQKEWGWLIAIYLFLGGLGAGAYTIAAINSFLGKMLEPSTVAGLWISFPALAIGSLCLLADLGTPKRAVLAGAKPKTSWIARGFWIISLFMILSFVHTMLFTFTDLTEQAAGQRLLQAIAIAGLVFAVLTMAYTGILLGASKGITFWRSGAVPVVFVVSALVTGHFGIMIGLVLAGGTSGATLQAMAGEAAALVAAEVLAIAFFLQAAWKEPDPHESAERLLRHPLFLAGYVLGGLLAPLGLMLLIYRGMEGPSAAPSVTLLGSLLGLAGGLILRQMVLQFGAMPTLNIAGLEFRRCPRPKEPKPPIGLLPPQ
ncbi:MAG: NrfD/PsrC family molybdoenzyme membrane anchor subunit [Planctomycetota bacterium]